MSTAVEIYTIELEALSEHQDSPLPVRCIATNLNDKTSAETWMTHEKTRAMLKKLYEYDENVEDWMQQLADHHYADLISQRTGAKTDRCIVNSTELLPFGFQHEDLRPWKAEA